MQKKKSESIIQKYKSQLGSEHTKTYRIDNQAHG